MVLIQGTAESLKMVQKMVVEKVYEFPVPKDMISGDRAKQVSNIYLYICIENNVIN